MARALARALARLSDRAGPGGRRSESECTAGGLTGVGTGGSVMDSDCFDRLARTVSTADTRRGVLQLLSALPLAGALTVLLAEESPAGRRKRRTDRPRQ